MHVDVNGITLHYEIHGQGEPLLWLHGGTGCGADWRHVFEEPPRGFQLIAPDLRGHGRSTWQTGAMTFRQMALDVIGLLDHLGQPRIKAVGLSGGGIVLLHVATLRPALVDALVAISAPPYFPEQTRRIQRQFSPSMMGDAEMARMRRVHLHGDEQIARLFAWTREMADTYDDVNFTPPLLSTIAADTLIVFGDRDPLYPLSMAVDLKNAIPKSYLWVVPNGGHGPVFGARAQQFVQTSLSFLRGEWNAS